jgi:PAS domain S-box-containing protein
METSSDAGRLLELVSRCTLAPDPCGVIEAALAVLPTLLDDDRVAIVRPGADPTALAARWHAERVGTHPLPGHAGTLVTARAASTSQPDPMLEAALAVLDTCLAQRQLEEEYADLVARVDNAQRLADMGDYDWHIASDTNRWSDQLFRIYGHEPQSFNASYDRFLEMVHPDDRDHIVAVHAEAYRTGEPYQMVERIVRPDGEVRHLASNGQVLHDAAGVPLRFRGTCVDITERVRAEREHEEIAARLAEDRARQRQALELNDSVVQGLVAASYALQLADPAQALEHVTGTLAAARAMMDDLLEQRDGHRLAAGDLVRSSPAAFDVEEPR